MNENEKIREEVVKILEELEHTEPIDEKHNPFAVLKTNDLLELKKTIEEFSEELTHRLYSNE